MSVVPFCCSSQKAKGLTKLFLLVTICVFCDIRFLLSPNSSSYICAASPVHRNDWKDLVVTIPERDKLHLLKERVKNKLPEYYMHTDFYLIRWLRARNLDVGMAEKMLLENVKWREKNKISSIMAEDFSDIADEYPVTTDCVDKFGRPVGTIDYGIWDVSAITAQGRLGRLIRLIDYFQEDLVRQVLEAQAFGKSVTRAVVLVDMDGFSFFQHVCPACMNVFLRLLIGMEAHYPGFWEEIIVINAPSVFRLMYDAIQGVVSTQNRESITIFDKNKLEWTHYLDERIERNQRYLNFGGERAPETDER